MKGIIKVIIAVIVAAVAVGVGVNVVKNITDSPKSTIEKFETSYNSVDLDGMVECFEPSVQSLYAGANSLMGEIIGMDISDLVSLAPFLEEFDDDIDFSDFPKMNININDIDKTSDTTASVYCEITIDGVEDSSEVVIDTVKIDDEWYITIDNFY